MPRIFYSQRPSGASVWGLAMLLFALAFPACSSVEDMEAKARIFSPEEPKKSEAQAASFLDATALDRDGSLAHRVLTMDPEEAFRRIGAHKLKATASFEWRMADKKASLREQREVFIQSTDKFLLHNENDQGRGHDLMLLGHQSYMRPLYLPWRQRVRETRVALQELADNYGLLKSMTTMMKDRVALVADGQEDVGGRQAVRYTMTLAKDPLVPVKAKNIPPPVYPQGSPSEDTQIRLDFLMLGVPQSLEGRLWVDAQSSVPLKSELWASVGVLTKGSDALLQLKMSHELFDIGTSETLSPPEKFLPAEDRPNAIAAALTRFGMEKPKEDAQAQKSKDGDATESTDE